jgi:hypothetical protein
MRKSCCHHAACLSARRVLGLFVRRWELDTVFDSATGLTARYAPVTLLLIGLSAAVLVLSAVLGIVVASRHKAEPEYGRAFKPGSFLYVGASFIFGLGLLAAVVLQYFRRSATGIVTIIDWIFLLLAALTAVSVILLAMGAYTRRRGGRMILFSIIPPLFFCFWLIVLTRTTRKIPSCLTIATRASRLPRRR